MSAQEDHNRGLGLVDGESRSVLWEMAPERLPPLEALRVLHDRLAPILCVHLAGVVGL